MNIHRSDVIGVYVNIDMDVLFLNIIQFTGADLGLLAEGVSLSRSHVMLLTNRGGGHMGRSTYIRVNISRLLIRQSLH